MSTIHARVHFALIGAATLGVLAGTAHAAILEVCASGCPYTTIQSAIDAALDGDTVLVHDGTYLESIDFLGKVITVQSVNGPDATTIDGGGAGWVVSFSANEPRETVLDGFTITNGQGGVICGYASWASPTIQSCVIRGNSAASGGGVRVGYGSPALVGCTIAENTATYGAGVHFVYPAPGVESLVSGCTIADNVGEGVRVSSDVDATQVVRLIGTMVSGNAGPGINVAMGTAWILDSAIERNSGAGVLAECGGSMAFAHAYLERCRIAANGEGGIVVGDFAHATATSCDIRGNLATGVLFSSSASGRETPDLSNCTITGNLGGGVQSFGFLSVVNCTISRNYSESSIGGAGITVAYADVRNSILWGNDGPGGTGASDQIAVYAGGSIAVTYSDVQGGWPGEGNIEAGPTFVEPIPVDQAPTVAGNYHLRPGSPCVDAGTADGAPPDDIDGDLRPIGLGFDMGSDECDPTHIFIDGFESGSTSAWSATLP